MVGFILYCTFAVQKQFNFYEISNPKIRKSPNDTGAREFWKLIFFLSEFSVGLFLQRAPSFSNSKFYFMQKRKKEVVAQLRNEIRAEVIEQFPNIKRLRVSCYFNQGRLRIQGYIGKRRVYIIAYNDFVNKFRERYEAMAGEVQVA